MGSESRPDRLQVPLRTRMLTVWRQGTFNFRAKLRAFPGIARWQTSWLKYLAGLIAFVLTIGARPVPVSAAQDVSFRIPPVKIPLNIKDQPITIVASEMISMISTVRDMTTFRLELVANLADLQQNVTGLLGSELDKSDECGDRIQIQHATLDPAEPASVAVVQLHYERWACIKIFGKRQVKKLVDGNAVIHMKLTPAVGENNTELKLIPAVGDIEADGSLGELLRSGTLGDMLREKIRESILSAMQKGTDLSATVPPAAQGYASIQDARFRDAGAGRLMVVLDGEIRISKEQAQALSRELKERAGLQ
jgi:hypothetical protein